MKNIFIYGLFIVFLSNVGLAQTKDAQPVSTTCSKPIETTTIDQAYLNAVGKTKLLGAIKAYPRSSKTELSISDTGNEVIVYGGCENWSGIGYCDDLGCSCGNGIWGDMDNCYCGNDDKSNQ